LFFVNKKRKKQVKLKQENLMFRQKTKQKQTKNKTGKLDVQAKTT
jgi:hypothetical protein